MLTDTRRAGRGKEDVMNKSHVTPTPAPRKFRTILADPPWDIGQRSKWGAISHYDVMTVDHIKQMPIADLAEDNAHLYLWVTNGAIREGIDAVSAWGV